jgi:hypothetical protein
LTSSRHKNPNIKWAKKYFLEKKLSYTAAAQPINEPDTNSVDEAEDISIMQKQLSDHLNKSVWEEKASTTNSTPTEKSPIYQTAIYMT